MHVAPRERGGVRRRARRGVRQAHLRRVEGRCLARLDAPWAPVQSVSELLDDPQVEANGYVGDVVIDGEPAYRLPAVPVQFDGQAPPLRRAPEHGEDTEIAAGRARVRMGRDR